MSLYLLIDLTRKKFIMKVSQLSSFNSRVQYIQANKWRGGRTLSENKKFPYLPDNLEYQYLLKSVILSTLNKEKHWEMGARSRKTACSFFYNLTSISEKEPSRVPCRNEGKRLPEKWFSFKTEPLHIQPIGRVWSWTAKPQYIRKSCFSEMDGKAPSRQDVLVPTLWL